MEQTPPDNVNSNVPQFLTKSALSRKWACGTKPALQKSTVWLPPEEHLHAHSGPILLPATTGAAGMRWISSLLPMCAEPQGSKALRSKSVAMAPIMCVLHSWVVKGSRDRCVVGRQVNIQQSKNIHTHPNRLVHLLHVLHRCLLSFC